ncbi:MAG: type II toxin-antitoxin system HicA family toxin [Pseudomonadota bacterium]
MPSSLGSREVLKQRKADGGVLAGRTGSHHHLKHPVKPGKVTAPHPARDLPIGTLKSIERQSGINRTSS